MSILWRLRNSVVSICRFLMQKIRILLDYLPEGREYLRSRDLGIL